MKKIILDTIMHTPMNNLNETKDPSVIIYNLKVMYFVFLGSSLLYPLLILLIQLTGGFGTPQKPSTIPIQLLLIVFYGVSVVSIGVIYAFLIPKINEQVNNLLSFTNDLYKYPDEAIDTITKQIYQQFGYFVIIIVLAESIGIYGLVIGLLEMIYISGTVQWLEISPFFIGSFVVIVDVYMRYFNPSFDKLKSKVNEFASY